MRGGGGGRLGDGVKTAPGLGREEGLTVPTPPGPRPRDTLVAGVGGLIDDEEDDEAGGLPEVLLLLLLPIGYIDCDFKWKGRKFLCLCCGELALWR